MGSVHGQGAGQTAFGELLHGPGLLLVGQVVVAQQMEDAVDDQAQEVLLGVQAVFLGLAPGGVHADHHVAQQPGGQVGELALGLGKGDDVGGAVLAQVLQVELVDVGIVGDDQGEFGLRAASRVF